MTISSLADVQKPTQCIVHNGASPRIQEGMGLSSPMVGGMEVGGRAWIPAQVCHKQFPPHPTASLLGQRAVAKSPLPRALGKPLNQQPLLPPLLNGAVTTVSENSIRPSSKTSLYMGKHQTLLSTFMNSHC